MRAPLGAPPGPLLTAALPFFSRIRCSSRTSFSSWGWGVGRDGAAPGGTGGAPGGDLWVLGCSEESQQTRRWVRGPRGVWGCWAGGSGGCRDSRGDWGSLLGLGVPVGTGRGPWGGHRGPPCGYLLQSPSLGLQPLPLQLGLPQRHLQLCHPALGAGGAVGVWGEPPYPTPPPPPPAQGLSQPPPPHLQLGPEPLGHRLLPLPLLQLLLRGGTATGQGGQG